MTNALYEGIDKQLAARDAEIAALRKALQSIVDDLELRMGAGTICLATPVQIARDALLTPRTL